MRARPTTIVFLLTSALAGAGLALACTGDDPKPTAGGADASATDESTADGASPSPDGSSTADGGADAASDSASDAPAAFDPKSIPGLVLWLDPAAGVTETGGKVSAWKDQSASSITVTQTNAANQPAKGNVGGKPVIAGTATTWLEASGTAVGTKLDFGDGDMLAELVVSTEVTSVGLGGVLYKVIEDVAPYDGLQMYGNISLDGKPGIGLDGDSLLLKAAAGNMADGKLHLVGFRRSGDRLYLSLDGVAGVATPPSSSNKRAVDNTSPLRVGGRPSGVHSIVHKLGDVVIYKGAVAPAQVTELEAYLKAKNGI